MTQGLCVCLVFSVSPLFMLWVTFSTTSTETFCHWLFMSEFSQLRRNDLFSKMHNKRHPFDFWYHMYSFPNCHLYLSLPLRFHFYSIGLFYYVSSCVFIMLHLWISQDGFVMYLNIKLASPPSSLIFPKVYLSVNALLFFYIPAKFWLIWLCIWLRFGFIRGYLC